MEYRAAAHGDRCPKCFLFLISVAHATSQRSIVVSTDKSDHRSRSVIIYTRENPFAFRRLRRLRRPGRPASPARFYFSFALRRFPHSPTLCRLMLARSNGPVLDAQRTFKYQTATVLRGAYLQPLSRALTRPHALTRTVASLRLATAIYA